jgi:hypothetical protein
MERGKVFHLVGPQLCYHHAFGDDGYLGPREELCEASAFISKWR